MKVEEKSSLPNSPLAAEGWRLIPFLTLDRLQWLIVVFCLLIFTGFNCSRALASIGMIGILVASLLYYGPLQMSLAYYRRKELLVLSLYFWVVFISGIYSEDKQDWLNWVRIKLPCIALPLAFAPLARLDDKKFKALLGGFIVIFFISGIVVLTHYLLNYEAVTDSFKHGSAISMPFSHIRYTLMIAFSFFCCIYLLTDKELVPGAALKWLLIIAAVFAFVVLHVFTVRSGLIALYLGCIYWSLNEMFRRKKIFIGVSLIFIIVIAPFAAYKLVPSFHNKISYMSYDLSRYQAGEINDKSDAMRLVSMKIGMEIWKQHPIIGVGAGDLGKECNKIYKAEYPQITAENYRLPHNQFIWMLATTGIIGLAAFLFAFSYPLFVNGNYKSWIFSVLHLSIFSSFFTEHTFEEQVGIGFYLVFVVLFINRLQKA